MDINILKKNNEPVVDHSLESTRNIEFQLLSMKRELEKLSDGTDPETDIAPAVTQTLETLQQIDTQLQSMYSVLQQYTDHIKTSEMANDEKSSKTASIQTTTPTTTSPSRPSPPPTPFRNPPRFPQQNPNMETYPKLAPWDEDWYEYNQNRNERLFYDQQYYDYDEYYREPDWEQYQQDYYREPDSDRPYNYGQRYHRYYHAPAWQHGPTREPNYPRPYPPPYPRPYREKAYGWYGNPSDGSGPHPAPQDYPPIFSSDRPRRYRAAKYPSKSTSTQEPAYSTGFNAVPSRSYKIAYYPWQQTLGAKNPVNSRVPYMNLYDLGQEYEVYMELPGVVKENLELRVDEQSIWVNGKPTLIGGEDGQPVIQEHGYHEFYRQVHLPSKVISNKTTCVFENGILRIKLVKYNPKQSANKIKIE